MKRIIAPLFLLLCVQVSAQKKTAEADAKMNQFVSALMQKMTVDEKIGQLNLPGAGDIVTGQASNSDIGKKIRDGHVGGLFNIKGVDKIREVQRVAVEQTRLKIPMIFGMDVIHGYQTTFPIPLALACTWDMNLIEQSARIAATEASADGIGWTFSPMVDICRDPRWGRIAEGSGEDPFLGSEIAKAMVRGYQGNLNQDNNILSCVKHFALYGAAEAGRDYNTANMDRERMFNDYLPPFKAAVDAGVGSVMASFNDVEGVPATGNRFLLTDVLRKKWGFKGFVVSDYTGINEMIAHGMGNLQQVSALALNAGLDMDMVGEGFLTTLKKSLKEGKITQKQIDDACRLVLEAKYKLGLFNNPYKFCNKKRSETEIYTPEHIRAARTIAAESFVLLKNDNQLLPIKKTGTIALIGPLGNNRNNMAGTWSVATDFNKCISVKEGLEKAVGSKAQIIFAQGSNLMYDSVYQKNATMFGREIPWGDDAALLKEALDVAEKSDIIVAALGEASEMTGESSSRTDLDIPDAQKDLLKALLKTGKPVVLVLFTGRPLTIKWESEHVPAILNVWFGGSETGNAIADVLFGDVNPSGKLTTTFPQNVGQIPIYYAHKNTGRPVSKGTSFEKFTSNYLDVSNFPVYPFGYGLSYTSFSYGEVKLSNRNPRGNTSIRASITVTNTGTRTGKEVVQLYIRDMVASITRPVKELKGFQKIELGPGESREVTFQITPELLKFYKPAPDCNSMKYDWEPGEFQIMIGGNSAEVKMQTLDWKK
ncbi:MAG: beta-glucosidase BglX [Chitinophagaceae bacterium]|nr:beta-glucosidase BglX [Chitinophagaceae bacterium]MCW5917303.1 beta-glucosidase BglX [Ferruginibacter sp.]